MANSNRISALDSDNAIPWYALKCNCTVQTGSEANKPCLDDDFRIHSFQEFPQAPIYCSPNDQRQNGRSLEVGVRFGDDWAGG